MIVEKLLFNEDGSLNQMLLFFTCKNILIIFLQFYRFMIICCDENQDGNLDGEDAQLKLLKTTLKKSIDPEKGQFENRSMDVKTNTTTGAITVVILPPKAVAKEKSLAKKKNASKNTSWFSNTTSQNDNKTTVTDLDEGKTSIKSKKSSKNTSWFSMGGDLKKDRKESDKDSEKDKVRKASKNVSSASAPEERKKSEKSVKNDSYVSQEETKVDQENNSRASSILEEKAILLDEKTEEEKPSE